MLIVYATYASKSGNCSRTYAAPPHKQNTRRGNKSIEMRVTMTCACLHRSAQNDDLFEIRADVADQWYARQMLDCCSLSCKIFGYIVKEIAERMHLCELSMNFSLYESISKLLAEANIFGW